MSLDSRGASNLKPISGLAWQARARRLNLNAGRNRCTQLMLAAERSSYKFLIIDSVFLLSLDIEAQPVFTLMLIFAYIRSALSVGGSLDAAA